MKFRLIRIRKELLNKKSFFIGIIILFIFILGFVAYGSQINQITFKQSVKKLTNIFYLPYYLKGHDLPVYTLKIDSKDLEKLDDNLPGEGGMLLEENKVYVPAEFWDDQGNKYEVKVKYRGDMAEHWRYEKKSWHLQFSKGNFFEGKRELDLIIPKDRNYLTEYLNNYRAEKFGLTVPDSKMVVVKVNGQKMVYFATEGLGKEFLEKHQLSGDNNFYGTKDEAYFNQENHYLNQLSLWKKYTRDLNNNKKDRSDLSLLFDILNNASDQDFYQLIPQIVDMDNFYAWQVHSLLVASPHQTTENFRFYFNSQKGKFEFVPWNVGQASVRNYYNEDNYNLLVTRILENPKFLHQRNLALWHYIKDDKNFEDDLNFYDNAYKETKVAFIKDRAKFAPNYYFIKEVKEQRNLLVSNSERAKNLMDFGQVFIKVTTNPQEKNVWAKMNLSVNTFSAVNFSGFELEWQANQINPNLKLHQDSNQNGIFDFFDEEITTLNYDLETGQISVEGLNQTLLARRQLTDDQLGLEVAPNDYNFFIVGQKSDQVNFQKADFSFNNYFSNEAVGYEVTYVDTLAFADFSKINLTIDEFLTKPENSIFRKIDNQTLVLGPGSYTISQDIIIPKDLSLVIRPGTILRFTANTSLVSYSPVQAIGVKGAPIIFTALNKNQPWGVVALSDIEEKSAFSNAVFEYGSDDYINGVFYSGQLSAYYSDVELTENRFNHAFGDDGVNIKNSNNSLIARNYFFQNSADGLDVDFSDSRIENNYFLDNGNDGIDLSGSQPLVYGNLIEGSGDKGISIGEKSLAKVENNLVLNCNIGIAIKDLSDPEIINNSVLKNKVGISAYQKKPIFGGGQGKITSSLVWHNDKSIDFDDKSKVEISQSNIQGGFPGSGNIDEMPIFENEDQGNYILTNVSSDNIGIAELPEKYVY